MLHKKKADEAEPQTDPAVVMYPKVLYKVIAKHEDGTETRESREVANADEHQALRAHGFK
jgi:hypothetical protein